MRSFMLMLVCALSVSARCVKRQAANETASVVLKSSVTKQGSQTGSGGRRLLEESSAGSEDFQSATNTTQTPEGQSNDQEGTSTSESGNQDGPSSDSASSSSNSSSADAGSTSLPGLDDTSTTVTDFSPSGGGASTSCGSLKNICFNSGMQPSMFDQMTTASQWTTFGLDIPGGSASSRAKQAHIPMMAFKEHVERAVELVNGPNAPEWLLTFNEPDYSYMGMTPTMKGAEAAEAIKPLLAKPGSKTKFVAPVTAFPDDPFLDEFFAACDCNDFFSAYNIHQYQPTSAGVISTIESYHNKWNDKPLWITELAPGGANCALSWDDTNKFMKEMFKFSKDAGYIDKVFWNTGNQIDGKDSNVCNSWLVDGSGKPGPLLEMFEAVDCS
ncbi:MAG: hypothetical protein Q9178_004168 [Gyalolechia marmorata]